MAHMSKVRFSKGQQQQQQLATIRSRSNSYRSYSILETHFLIGSNNVIVACAAAGIGLGPSRADAGNAST